MWRSGTFALLLPLDFKFAGNKLDACNRQVGEAGIDNIKFDQNKASGSQVKWWKALKFLAKCVYLCMCVKSRIIISKKT